MSQTWKEEGGRWGRRGKKGRMGMKKKFRHDTSSVNLMRRQPPAFFFDFIHAQVVLSQLSLFRALWPTLLVGARQWTTVMFVAGFVFMRCCLCCPVCLLLLVATLCITAHGNLWRTTHTDWPLKVPTECNSVSQFLSFDWLSPHTVMSPYGLMKCIICIIVKTLFSGEP